MKSDYAIKTEVAVQLTYILKHVFIYFDLKKRKKHLEKGHGYPLQYSCLENPMVRKAWQATVTGSQRVRHDLATKHACCFIKNTFSSGYNLKMFITETLSKLTGKKELKWPIYCVNNLLIHCLGKLIFPSVVLSIILSLHSIVPVV